MVTNILVNGKMVCSQAMESTLLLMAQSTLAIMSMMNATAKVPNHTKMVTSMKVNGKVMNIQDTVSSLMLMAQSILAIGLMADATAKA